MTAQKTFTSNDVRLIRIDAGLSQEGFAARFTPPLSPKTVSSWENDRDVVPVVRAREIVEFCGLTPEKCESIGANWPELPPENAPREYRQKSDVTTGADVRALRLQLGLKQREFAESLGVKTNVVAQWESRKNDRIPFSAPGLIAVALGWESNGTTAANVTVSPVLPVANERDEMTRARIISNVRKLDESQLSAVDAFVAGVVKNQERENGGAV